MRRTKEEKAKEKARDRRLAKGFGSFLKDKDAPGVTLKEQAKLEAKADMEWRALPKEKRIKIRRKYKARGENFTAFAWWSKRQAAQDDPHPPQKEGRAHRKGKADTTVTLTISHDKKKLDKHIRKAMEIPTSPKKPFVALLQSVVIVPDNPEHKVVVADAGSIVKLADMTTLYRESMSPITHRADEILVHFGNAKTQALGWISGRFATAPDEVMKPSKGPTFLVKTSSEEGLSAWDRFRLKVARTRAKDPTNWIAPWLAYHGHKYPRELKEVTRLFGGKPIKNEEVEVRIERLFSLILHTELDMATAKSKKNKKNKKAKRSARTEKPEKKVKAKKKSSLGESEKVSSKYNDYVIKRLIKENPFREGSNRAKLWKKLKKGMTVIEFNAFGEGRARTELRHYRDSGWIKLRKPAAA